MVVQRQTEPLNGKVPNDLIVDLGAKSSFALA